MTLCQSPNKNNNEGGGGNDIWIRTFVGVGLVIGDVVGLYFDYKIGQAIERNCESCKRLERGMILGFSQY